MKVTKLSSELTNPAIPNQLKIILSYRRNNCVVCGREGGWEGGEGKGEGAWLVGCLVGCACVCVVVGWFGLGWVGLGWVGLVWVGLGWVGLGGVEKKRSEGEGRCVGRLVSRQIGR